MHHFVSLKGGLNTRELHLILPASFWPVVWLSVWWLVKKMARQKVSLPNQQLAFFYFCEGGEGRRMDMRWVGKHTCINGHHKLNIMEIYYMHVSSSQVKWDGCLMFKFARYEYTLASSKKTALFMLLLFMFVHLFRKV